MPRPVVAAAEVSWARYIFGHPERLPRAVSAATANTWADVAPAEYRRVTRNWRRWQERRRKARG